MLSTLVIGEPVRSRTHQDRSAIMAVIAYSIRSAQLCALLPSHMFERTPGEAEETACTSTMRLQPLPLESTAAPIVGYVPAERAVRIAPIPANILIDDSDALDWCGATRLAAPDATAGKPVYVLQHGNRMRGQVSALDAPFWIDSRSGGLVAYSGGMQITLNEAAEPQIVKSGATVLTEAGELAGFVIAGSELEWIVAPAEPLFARSNLSFATNDQVREHNARARSLDLPHGSETVGLFQHVRRFGVRVRETSQRFSSAA